MLKLPRVQATKDDREGRTVSGCHELRNYMQQGARAVVIHKINKGSAGRFWIQKRFGFWIYRVLNAFEENLFPQGILRSQVRNSVTAC